MPHSLATSVYVSVYGLTGNTDFLCTYLTFLVSYHLKKKTLNILEKCCEAKGSWTLRWIIVPESWSICPK